MATNAPAVLVPLTAEPVMTQHLRVEVMSLERGVVYV